MKHSSSQFEEDLNRLKEKLLLMGGTIESMMNETQEALLTSNSKSAGRVIRRDNEIDSMEKEVDKMAIQILATRQPAATDLRFVASAFKICTDLERMGDILVNICERVIELAQTPKLKDYEILPKMMNLTRAMIAGALDAFVNQSTDTATKVMQSDREIDELTRTVYRELIEIMKVDPTTVERGMKLFFIAKYLERMADHATNIAEQVIFTVKGLDIRHSHAPGPTPLVN